MGGSRREVLAGGTAVCRARPHPHSLNDGVCAAVPHQPECCCVMCTHSVAMAAEPKVQPTLAPDALSTWHETRLTAHEAVHHANSSCDLEYPRAIVVIPV